MASVSSSACAATGSIWSASNCSDFGPYIRRGGRSRRCSNCSIRRWASRELAVLQAPLERGAESMPIAQPSPQGPDRHSELFVHVIKVRARDEHIDGALLLARQA